MASPLVSILTPAYNSSAFIADTVAAALAQTCADFELLVVDDESTDDTIDVVHRVAAGDPRVIVMVSAHGGPAVARNAGLDAARGRFIALLDSDDVWMPAYLEEQLTLLGRFRDSAIVTANAINRGGARNNEPFWPSTRGHRRLSPRDLILQEDSVCIMSVFRREVVDRIGGFDRRYTGNEDYEFWLRAANAGFGIVQNRRPLGYYRRRDDSVSSDDIRMLNGIIKVLETAERMDGAIARERVAVKYQLQRFRYDLVKAEMRVSLSKHDAAQAALGLKALSELRGGWGLAVAAKLGMTWPDLLQRAYELHRTLTAAS
jgi:teichuronic acid biosynthesis glycosyltransferase TuaG